LSLPTVKMTANASGAAEAGSRGDVVLIVDVIDMSTTLESALEAGALAVFGASPDDTAPPVAVSPAQIGQRAGELAVAKNAGVVLVAEPRAGTDEQRLQRVKAVTGGLARAGARVCAVLPNIGAETPKLYDLRGKVVIAVTAAGGVAFDAACAAGAPAVVTGTVARTLHSKGTAPALAAAKRAVAAARASNAGITVVAASGNALEDVLAAEYITRLVMEEYFRKGA